MRARWTALLFPLPTAVACGALSGSDDDETIRLDDGGKGADVVGVDGTDANEGAPPPDGGPCDLTQPFGAPKLLAAVNTGLDDELSAWPFGGKIFVERVDTQTSSILLIDPDGGSTQTVSLTAVGPGNPTLSDDGNTMFYDQTVDDSGVTTKMLARAKRASPTTLVFAPQDTIDFSGTLTSDGQILPRLWGSELWFSAAIGGVWKLYHATVVGQIVSAPTVADELHQDGQGEFLALLTGDRKRIYFARGTATNKVFTASRAAVTDAFGSVTEVMELNKFSDHLPSWISEDGCTIWMSAKAADPGTPSYDIYVATKP
jgi:hypothetical protein